MNIGLVECGRAFASLSPSPRAPSLAAGQRHRFVALRSPHYGRCMVDTKPPITRGDLAVFLFGLFLLWFVWEVRVVFMLVAFALLLAYGLDPVVRRIEVLPGGRVSRRMAAGLVIFTLLVLLALAIGYGAPVMASQVAGFLSRVPEQLAQLSETVRARAADRKSVV